MRRWGCAATVRGTAVAVMAAAMAITGAGWAAPAPTARDGGRVVDGRGTASRSRPSRGSLGAPPRAGQAAQVVSTAAQRRSVTVTVYSNGLALVQERRRVTLPAGAVVLRYRDVPAALLADSVRLRVRPSGVAQLEQQAFHPATLTPAALLKAYQGKTVTLIQTRRVGGRMRRVKVQEKLIADSGGQIWEVNGHYVVHGPGDLPAFEAPRLPADLFAQPTLVWRLHSRRHDAVTIVTRYLTSGLDWHAAYALTLAAGGASGELSAALAVENRSGVAYPDARLRLVAGQVNSAPPLVFPIGVMAMQAAAAAAPPAVSAQRAYAYHLFAVRRPVSLAPQGQTQAPWLREVRVPVQRRYVVHGGAAFSARCRPRAPSSGSRWRWNCASPTPRRLGWAGPCRAAWCGSTGRPVEMPARAPAGRPLGQRSRAARSFSARIRCRTPPRAGRCACGWVRRLIYARGGRWRRFT